MPPIHNGTLSNFLNQQMWKVLNLDYFFYCFTTDGNPEFTFSNQKHEYFIDHIKGFILPVGL